ncbi:MAG: hypothetical protein NG737_06655 [Omnitrophica bacterium]|nr:hypothetical protein [Candidatus Omnitrophota bacterium]
MIINPQKKDIVISIAANYTLDKIRIFLLSLKETDFRGDIYLFVSNISSVASRALKRYGVHLIPFKEKYPYANDAIPVDTEWSRSSFGNLKLYAYRFIMYYFFLEEYKERYSRVMLSDIRDVVFQRNPFEFSFDDDSLYCFCENKNISIKQNLMNAGWIRTLYGEKVLQQIGDKSIVCAGITIGTVSVILNYLNTMVKGIKELGKTQLSNTDQAVHNYSIYTNKLKNVKLLKNEDGPIATLRLVSSEEIRTDKNGLVLNSEGNIMHVVHQYDGHPFLVKRIMEKYSSSGLRLGFFARRCDLYPKLFRWILSGCPRKEFKGRHPLQNIFLYFIKKFKSIIKRFLNRLLSGCRTIL